MKLRSNCARSVFVAALLTLLLYWPETALSHCDTMDGPVVKAAQQALDTGNPNSVLMWVQEANETEVRNAFERAFVVRKLSPEARDLANVYFYETVVRLHRAGEGAPYTGLKPSGSDHDPAVAEADKALESGSVEHLEKHLVESAAGGIRDRFTEAREAKKHAGESVHAGRRFVAAYVELVHYVERLHSDISAKTSEHGTDEHHGATGQHHHQ